MSHAEVLGRKARELMGKRSGPLGRPPAKAPPKWKGWDNAVVSITFQDGRYVDIGRSIRAGFGVKPTKDPEKMVAAIQTIATRIVKECLMRKGATPQVDEDADIKKATLRSVYSRARPKHGDKRPSREVGGAGRSDGKGHRDPDRRK